MKNCMIDDMAATSRLERTVNSATPDVVSDLEKHVLVDGFRIVIDLEKSRGAYLVDAASGRRWLDLYGFYGSLPVGFNHPHFDRHDVQEEFLAVSRTKVANADVY